MPRTQLRFLRFSMPMFKGDAGDQHANVQAPSLSTPILNSRSPLFWPPRKTTPSISHALRDRLHGADA